MGHNEEHAQAQQTDDDDSLTHHTSHIHQCITHQFITLQYITHHSSVVVIRHTLHITHNPSHIAHHTSTPHSPTVCFSVPLLSGSAATVSSCFTRSWQGVATDLAETTRSSRRLGPAWAVRWCSVVHRAVNDCCRGAITDSASASDGLPMPNRMPTEGEGGGGAASPVMSITATTAANMLVNTVPMRDQQA